MRLIGMTDFVLEKSKSINHPRTINIVIDYAKFLKKPLELWMFIPCYFRDGIWIPYAKDTLLNTIDLFNELEQAKERCLFEGFEVGVYPLERFVMHQDGFGFVIDDLKKQTIENLVKYNLQLTKTAEKLIGL